jgi:hypothetical protein
MKTGYVKRADLSLEQKLGRSLLPGEIAHHNNHDRLDDRPENLEAMNRGDHQRLHNKENTLKGVYRKRFTKVM